MEKNGFKITFQRKIFLRIILVLFMNLILVGCFNNPTTPVVDELENEPDCILTLSSKDGIVNGEGSYKRTELVTISSYTTENLIFSGWYVGDKLIAQSNSYSFNIAEDMNIEARYIVPGTTYNVVLLSEENGIVFGGGVYNSSETTKIYAVANSGYAFNGWYVNGNKVSDDCALDITVTKDITYTAKFCKTYTVKIENDSLFGEVYGEGTYKEGEEIVIEAINKNNYYFVEYGLFEVKSDEKYFMYASTNAINRLKIYNDIVVKVSFEYIKNPTIVDIEKYGNFSVSDESLGKLSFTYDDDIVTSTVTLLDDNARFVGWVADNFMVSRDLTFGYSITNGKYDNIVALIEPPNIGKVEVTVTNVYEGKGFPIFSDIKFNGAGTYEFGSIVYVWGYFDENHLRHVEADFECNGIKYYSIKDTYIQFIVTGDCEVICSPKE